METIILYIFAGTFIVAALIIDRVRADRRARRAASMHAHPAGKGR
jgi:hypothetical protein